MDINKAFEVAKMPVTALVAIAIAAAVIGVIPGLNFLLCVLGLPLLAVQIVLGAYIGFLVAKANMEMVDGAVLGGLTAGVSALIGGVVGLAATSLGFGAASVVGGGVVSGTVAVVDLSLMVMAIVINIVTSLVIGAVVAIIGYFIAKQMK